MLQKDVRRLHQKDQERMASGASVYVGIVKLKIDKGRKDILDLTSSVCFCFLAQSRKLVKKSTFLTGRF